MTTGNEATGRRDLRTGVEFWRDTLGSARFFLAPMVDASELPWRVLGRRFGAQVTVTPMLHAEIFVRDHKYRETHLQTDPTEDSPLMVQFCASGVKAFSEAARLAAPHCVAVDLNLGCPQMIAKRGHYGAFLMEEWDLISDMIHTATTQACTTITAKMRVYEDIEKTVEYALMLVRAGIKLLTVHGRRREQKGVLSGLASWEHIRAVKEALREHQIPVIANGNIQSLADAEECIRQTGCDGIMIAEASLYNAAVLSGIHPPCWRLAREYLELTNRYPTSRSYQRGHLFKIFYHVLQLDHMLDLRDRLSQASTHSDMLTIVSDIETRLRPKGLDDQFTSGDDELTLPQSTFPIPVFLCQPNYRSKSSSEGCEHREAETCENVPLTEPNNTQKRKLILDKLTSDSNCSMDSEQLNGLSNKKLKKLLRKPNLRAFHTVEEFIAAQETSKQKSKMALAKVCRTCPNVRGQKCDHGLCRSCCRSEVDAVRVVHCEGHKFKSKNLLLS